MAGIFSRLSNLLSGKRSSKPVTKDSAQPVAPDASFVPANALEQALVAAASDPAARAAFTAMILESDVLVATPDVPAESGTRTLLVDETVSFLSVAADNGVTTPALFTSEARLAECFGAGTGYMALNGRVLLELVAGDGVWLNPASAYGVHWDATDLSSILGRPVSRTIKQDTQILLGTPANRPEALIRELSARLAGDPRVTEAWLALAQWPQTHESGWYVELRSTEPADGIVADLASAFTQENCQGMAVDVRVTAPGSDPGNGIRLKPLSH